MPYSDDLYALLEEEEAHIEPIGETLTQDGTQGFDVTSEHGRLDTSTTDAVVASVDHDTGVAGEEEDPYVFSPTDGYFGTAPGASSGTLAPASSNAPHVPNVLVEDPSLQRDDAEGKAAEAARERLRNDREAPGSDVSSASAVTPTPTSHSGATYYAPSSSSRFPGVATLTSYTTFSTQRRSVYPSEHFPSIPNEAPPAYSPSPPVPSNTQQRFEGYRTFTQTRDAAIINMGRPEETQGLLARQPESMRDHNAHDVEEMSPTWWTRMRRAREHASWRSCKIVLIALVLFVVTAGFLTSIIIGPPGRTGSDNPASDEPQTDPGQPNMSYPDVDGDFAWDSASFCKDAKIHRRVQTFVANLGADKQLTLLERTVDEDGRRGWGEVHVQGAVVFRRAGPDTPQSAVTLEVAVTDERLDVTSSWDAEAGTLEVLVPHRVEWSKDRLRACVNVKITAWIPQNSKLKHLNTDGTALTSTVGTITSASTGTAARDDKLVDTTSPPPSYDFNSRIIDVHTTAAPITGVWPLYDYLGLQSTAGNVRVAIKPKEADADFPKPAILYVKTLSGDVRVREPIYAAQATFHIAQHTFSAGSADRRRVEAQAEAYLPPREYRVDVHTSSGDIDAAVAFGLSGGFKSTSGTVSLELLPVLDATQAEPGARTVELSTASTSGATDVKVLEPLWVDSFPVAAATQDDGGGSSWKPRTEGAKDEDDGDSAPPPLRCLHSTHTTTTANIKLRYPASWVGDISLGTLTGSLQVGGDGVKLIKAGSDWPGINKFLLARKGEKGEGGRLTAKSTSGDANVWIGGESAALSTERM
ncbi:uncharacterized protein P884DRAFT_250263 [Thermothelomyces heterothallicus CBS 202.75]|uniref:uncharacterized protein n=1 Tax=Thermothelomyces heterothallicus CBS 202.75 TaxID=1149848 RepID=UPI003742F702